ncbi:MAG: hypothetical protein V7767_09130 [Leeuwenhoekiella sp.]
MFILSVLALCHSMTYAQDKNAPPAPMRSASTPPPYGLPVPLDDYVFILFAAAILLGAWFVKKNESKSLDS